MSVGGSHLVIHLNCLNVIFFQVYVDWSLALSNSPKIIPQCNISCQKSMSVGVSHLVIHLKLNLNISCQKYNIMSVGGSHLVTIHLKLPQ